MVQPHGTSIDVSLPADTALAVIEYALALEAERDQLSEDLRATIPPAALEDEPVRFEPAKLDRYAAWAEAMWRR